MNAARRLLLTVSAPGSRPGDAVASPRYTPRAAHLEIFLRLEAPLCELTAGAVDASADRPNAVKCSGAPDALPKQRAAQLRVLAGLAMWAAPIGAGLELVRAEERGGRHPRLCRRGPAPLHCGSSRLYSRAFRSLQRASALRPPTVSSLHPGARDTCGADPDGESLR